MSSAGDDTPKGLSPAKRLPTAASRLEAQHQHGLPTTERQARTSTEFVSPFFAASLGDASHTAVMGGGGGVSLLGLTLSPHPSGQHAMLPSPQARESTAAHKVPRVDVPNVDYDEMDLERLLEDLVSPR
jgi:hypothetical protein